MISQEESGGGDGCVMHIPVSLGEEVHRISKVWDEKYYEVWVVKYTQMPARTYAIINRGTEVIEGVQATLYHSRLLAKQLSEWLDEPNPKEAALTLSPDRPTERA